MAQSDRRHPDVGQHDEWHVTVARALGRATRATAREIDIFRATLVRVRASLLPQLGPRRQPLPLLLKKLGEVVGRHSDEGFVTLQDDAAFWSLIRRIHASQPVAPGGRASGRVPEGVRKDAAHAGAKEPRGQGRSDHDVQPEPAQSESMVDAVGLIEAEIAAVERGSNEASATPDAGESAELESREDSPHEQATKEPPE